MTRFRGLDKPPLLWYNRFMAINITLDSSDRIEFTWAYGARTGYWTPKENVVLDTGGVPSQTFRLKLVEAINRYREGSKSAASERIERDDA